MSILSITDFIGRFHPVLVHLPIGILVVAVLFQWLTIKNRYAFLQPAIPVAMFWGMVGAVFSCISGYLLSLSGEYDKDLAGNHQWMGIAVAGFSLILYILYKLSLRETLARILSLVLLILIIITGHLGGTLTHGEGFLTSAISDGEKVTEIRIENIEEAIVYVDIVKPILQTKCYSCHGNSKQKGKLRLDSPESILKGGENGNVIVAGKADESELIKRIFLPLSDDDHMPPEAKPQLTENEILLLHWWVNSGADFQKKVSELQKNDNVKPALEALKGGTENTRDESFIPSSEIERADDKIVNRLREAGVVVIPVTRTSNYLEVNFISATSMADSTFKLLTFLKKQMVSLKVDSRVITDTFLNVISECTELRRLHLNNTSITDNGIGKLISLKELISLNLVGTGVTTKGLLQLSSLLKLKNIYLFQTEVSPGDWKLLRERMPGVNIDTGRYTVPTLVTDTTVIKY